MVTPWGLVGVGRCLAAKRVRQPRVRGTDDSEATPVVAASTANIAALLFGSRVSVVCWSKIVAWLDKWRGGDSTR